MRRASTAAAAAALLAATTLTLRTRAARAGGPDEPGAPGAPGAPAADEDPVKREARALMREGVRLLGTGDTAGALALFRSAYEKFPSAKILLNIASTLKTMGKDADAANAYQRYLDAADTDPARKTEIDGILTALDATVGKLTVAVDVADAEVQVGDDWFPAAQVKTLRVPAGEYTVRARKKGLPPGEAHGTLAAGASAQITVTLTPKPPEKPPEKLPEKPPAKQPDKQPLAHGAPDEPDDEIGAHAAPEEAESSYGGMVHFVADGKGRGGAALVGGVLEVAPQVELEAGAVIGPNPGAYAGGVFYVMGGSLRPRLAAGVPLFFSSGARFGVRAAGGLEWRANRHLAVVAELGVEHYMNPEGDIDATQFVPTLGLHGRL